MVTCTMVSYNGGTLYHGAVLRGVLIIHFRVSSSRSLHCRIVVSNVMSIMLGGRAPIYCLLLAVLLLFVQIGKAEDHGVHCSRARSRTVRRILEEYLLPFVENEKYNMSTGCRLHPRNDIFREQELEKQFLHINQWRCGYCKKVFEGEEFLDMHFDNRHHDMLNVSRQNCLADLCGALHCDYVETEHKHKFVKGKCSPSVDRNRHLCENLANSCFPPQERSAMRLNDFFLRQFCDAHTCKSGRTYFPRGKGRNANQAIYYAGCFFTILVVLLFYGGLYLYKRDTNLTVNSIKRLTQRTSYKHTKKH